MMVLLDLMRSYESMQRHMENSEKKRCLPSPYTSLSQQPGLHTLNGGVQGLRLMGVLPREEGDRVSLCPWAEPFAPSAFPGRVLLGVCAVEEGGEQRPTKACGDWARGRRAGSWRAPWLPSSPHLMHPRAYVGCQGGSRDALSSDSTARLGVGRETPEALFC